MGGLRRVLFLAIAGVLIARAAGAQPPGGLVLRPQDTFKGLKGHVSVMLSGGFDLDVFGDVVTGVLGHRDDAQLAIRAPRPWPDLYVAIPKRVEVAVGYAVTQKLEVVGRFSRANYTSQPLRDAGSFASLLGEGTVTLDLTPYRERSWEIGVRKHMKMTRRSKQYANLMYGLRTVEPIAAGISTTAPEGTIGTFRFYDRSKVKSISIEVGFTFEFGHVGLFTQVGARVQGRLKRIDEDLAPWSLELANNTGGRFYMPLQAGVLFRL